VCGGNDACIGCDGVPNSGVMLDQCGVCGGNNDCAGCDGVPNSGAVIDVCGNCGGNGSECGGCAPPTTNCGGCVDTSADAKNGGGGGATCAPGEPCADGPCRCPNPSDEDCGG